jgi:hypothetical protein
VYVDAAKFGRTGWISAREPNVDAQAQPADDEADRVRQLVLARFGGRVREFRVLIRGGGLVHHGKVETYFLKQMVQETVFVATSLCKVVNNIMVD